MRDYDATQLAIAASAYKKISWLFTIVDVDPGTAGPTTYYWSMIARSYGGHDYVYKIDPKSFRGIELNSTNTEHNIISPSDISFIIENSENVLTASNFINGTVLVDLVISDGTNETVMVSCKYRIKRCEAVYQTLRFTCESLIQEHLDSDYPNKRLIKDIIPSNDPDIDDGLCVPVPIGECYIPLRSLYIVDRRYYLLGLATGNIYNITKVRSPREWGTGKSEWESADYSFNKSTQTIDSVAWRVFQAIIHDSDGDNVADANGLWQKGDSFYDMPTQFTKDNTRWISGDQAGTHNGVDNAAILTDTGASWGVDKLIGAYIVNRTDGSYGKITDNDATTITATLVGGTDNDWDIGDSYTIGGPASCIKWICEDKGIPSSNIDDTSFAIAEKTFAGWGLTYNGIYDHIKPFSQVLAQLLIMCHSTLQFTDKVELHVLSKISQKTITRADVLRTSETGPGTFKYSLITQKQSDSGYIEFQVVNESQDKFIKKLVPAKATTDNISSAILTIPFVQDTQDVQRIGTLKYQREFTPKANVSFTNKAGTLLVLQPDDVITINADDYGGNYPVVVKSMFIKHNQSELFSIDFQCIQYSVDLDDWEDLSPAVISIGQDDSTVVFNAAGNRVFPVQPYPPYDIGDLWAGGPSSGIKRCKIARSSGAYQSGDWELASSYDNTGTTIENSAASMLINWNLTISNIDEMPAGIYPVESITDFSQVDFLDSNRDSIKILSTPDTTVAYGFPAIPINDKKKYTVVIRHKSSAASTNGLYLRLNQYNASLPAGKTHIGQSNGGVNTQLRTNLVDLVDNGAMPGTSWTVDTYTYIPAAGTKYVSFSMYNFNPATAEVEYHVDYVLMYVSYIEADIITSQGDLATTNEADADVLNMTHAPAEAGADVTPPLPSDENLVGYWSFDEGQGTIARDSSGNNNTGTLVGTPEWVDGVVGKALDFEADNNQYVSIPDSILTLNDDFTLSFRVCPEDDSTNSRWITLIDASDNFQVGIMGNESVFIRMDDTSIETASYTITYGTWYYIVVVRNNGAFILYINSVETNTFGGGLSGNGNFSAIGGGIDSYNCDGKIDEVRIYNIALTASQRKALFLNPGGSKAPIPGADVTEDNTANNTTYVNDSETQPTHAYDVRGIQRFYQLSTSNFTAMEFYDSHDVLAAALYYMYPSQMQFIFEGDHLVINSTKTIWMNTGHLDIPALVAFPYELDDDYTIPDYSGCLVYTCNAIKAITITLPDITAAHDSNGVIVIIKDISGNASAYNVTIDPYGSQTVEGNATYIINTNYGSVTLYSGKNTGVNSAWYILAEV